ncbi:MAG TPA: SDR family NAD(P)-dependent oxidoreductase [Acidimicrobiales bacterium]|nr:SDR family NAD(P)-dependent oxidoreductase [Acidimicrobiales bacterium]
MGEPVRFEGRVVVVTGAAQGMGRSHALELGARGARVVVNDLPERGSAVPERAAAVAREIAAAGGEAIAVGADVSSPRGCERLVERALSEFGRLDALIANAGVASAVPVARLEPAEAERVVGVNLLGAIHLTRAAWPHLARRGGRIVYISSAAGLYGAPGFAHYGPSKAGLVSLARVVSLEGAGVGIAANALAVAALTPMMEAMLSSAVFAARSGELEWWREHMRPELTTPAALWLVHPDCPARGRAFEARAGRVAEILLVETRGYLNPSHTLEDLRDSFAAVEDRSEWWVPEQSSEVARYERRLLAELARQGG